MTKKKSDVPIPEIYNEEQQFWANVAENATASIKQYKDGIKLAEATKEMAEGKIENNK